MFDFEGWATKNDLKCADGRIIRRDAFRVNDGQKVPLVWNHQWNSPDHVLGHAILENRSEGVYAKCSFNDSEAGRNAKEAVKHGDVTSLSIWANNLEQVGCDVRHGVIREVSLVLAGSNPGAFIESVLTHSEPMEDYDSEGIIYTGENIFLAHADEPKTKEEDKNTNDNKDSKTKTDDNEEKTIADVVDTMNEEQKQAMAVIVSQAIKETNEDNNDQNNDNKEEKEMKHNAFEERGIVQPASYLSHSQMDEIFKTGRQLGSLKAAFEHHLQAGGILAHALDTTGMTTAEGNSSYGINDMSMLFPDYKSLNTPPEFISREMGWVQKVMNGVHRTPFSRIKSIFADITEDEARAKGYIKGKEKKEEVFSLLKRTTDPQTVYKKQKFDRDDLIDITDYDILPWIRKEMRMMLDEEIARAILIGDGRPGDSDDKIKEDRVRPIAKDVSLFNTQIVIEVDNNATPAEIAQLTIDEIVRGRKKYKGSGAPKFWTTEDTITEMLLLKDSVGHRLYKTESELATAIRASEIVTVEPMDGYTLDVKEDKNLPIIGIMVNLQDYNVGADKGGEVNWFEDFDIDFNQQKYLVETRISGALVKPFSALTFVLKRKNA